MVSQLLLHERIETTLPRAKELRRLADKVITISKEVQSLQISAYTSSCSRRVSNVRLCCRLMLQHPILILEYATLTQHLHSAEVQIDV